MQQKKKLLKRLYVMNWLKKSDAIGTNKIVKKIMIIR